MLGQPETSSRYSPTFRHLGGLTFHIKHKNMEILDNEPKYEDPSARLFGFLGGLAFVISCLATMVSLYGVWKSYLSMQTAGAPDAISLADGILISLISQLAIVGGALFGFICQMIAFYKYAFSPVWMWRLMLVNSLLLIASGLFPFNWMSMLLSLAVMVHLFSKKDFY